MAPYQTPGLGAHGALQGWYLLILGALVQMPEYGLELAAVIARARLPVLLVHARALHRVARDVQDELRPPPFRGLLLRYLVPSSFVVGLARGLQRMVGVLACCLARVAQVEVVALCASPAGAALYLLIAAVARGLKGRLLGVMQVVHDHRGRVLGSTQLVKLVVVPLLH